MTPKEIKRELDYCCPGLCYDERTGSWFFANGRFIGSPAAVREIIEGLTKFVNTPGIDEWANQQQILGELENIFSMGSLKNLVDNGVQGLKSRLDIMEMDDLSEEDMEIVDRFYDEYYEMQERQSRKEKRRR